MKNNIERDLKAAPPNKAEDKRIEKLKMKNEKRLWVIGLLH